MRLTLRFDFYSIDDLSNMVRHRSRALQWPVDEEVFGQIAQRSRGTPRLALRLLQSCHRVCRANGDSEITSDHLVRACALEQIDALGLGPTEQKYLSLLAESSTRLNVLASVLGLPSRTVAEVTEPFLIRSGLLTKDDQGRRQLTALGHQHVSSIRQQAV
jgi:Holliday junction DNA helicase RuvB